MQPSIRGHVYVVLHIGFVSSITCWWLKLLVCANFDNTSQQEPAPCVTWPGDDDVIVSSTRGTRRTGHISGGVKCTLPPVESLRVYALFASPTVYMPDDTVAHSGQPSPNSQYNTGGAVVLSQHNSHNSVQCEMNWGSCCVVTTQQLPQYVCQHTSAPETSALTTQQQQSCISLRFVHSTTQDPVSAFSTHQSVLNFCSTAIRGRSVADVSPAYTPDMELGHRVNGLFGSSFTSGWPGHRVIILTRCETRVFPVFEKMPKMQNVHLKCWNGKSLSGGGYKYSYLLTLSSTR